VADLWQVAEIFPTTIPGRGTRGIGARVIGSNVSGINKGSSLIKSIFAYVLALSNP